MDATDRAGRNLTLNSDSWGWTKVTIASGPTATKAASKAVLSCKVYHYSGTATYIDPVTATTSCPALPTTLATALELPVTNLDQMSFIGTANDVVMVVWRK